MLLNESGIRLPHGAKSAKIVTHQDMDGFISALLIYNQLIRQGMPADRINIKFVQYGDNDLLDKATRKNKTQALLSCDFSAFPKVDMAASWNSFARTYDKDGNRYIPPAKDSDYQAFKKQYINTTPSFKTISTFLKQHNPDALLFKKPNDSSVRISLENFIKGWKAYKGDDNVTLTDMDYTSDHHENTKGDLVPGKSGKIGAEYRSDAEHIATVAAQGLMNWDDIEAVSRVDSATYKNVKDTMYLPSALKSKDRKERIAIMINALITPILKSNERLAELLIKRSGTSLISIYNNALKMAKLNDNELAVLKELKNENPDWTKIDELTKDLPGYEKKKLLQTRDEHKNYKPVPSIQQLRDKNEKNIEREKLIDKTDFTFYGNVAVFKARNMRDQPNRYLFAFLEHEGVQPAFVIKKMPGIGMIQVAASPLISESEKEKIDLEPICKRALDAAEKEGLLNEFTKKMILQSSGGHKTIYNISGMDIISNTTLSPNERYETKDLTSYEKRRTALYKNALTKTVKDNAKNLADKSKRLEELKGQKSAALAKAMDFIEDFLIKEIRAEYGNIKPRSEFKIKMEK